jgi:mRNA interferase RelE/StbE
MYKVYLLETAAEELADLDKPVAERIARRIQWLAENVETLSPITLKGDLSGLYKLRDGRPSQRDLSLIIGSIDKEVAQR